MSMPLSDVDSLFGDAWTSTLPDNASMPDIPEDISIASASAICHLAEDPFLMATMAQTMSKDTSLVAKSRYCEATHLAALAKDPFKMATMAQTMSEDAGLVAKSRYWEATHLAALQRLLNMCLNMPLAVEEFEKQMLAMVNQEKMRNIKRFSTMQSEKCKLRQRIAELHEKLNELHKETAVFKYQKNVMGWSKLVANLIRSRRHEIWSKARHTVRRFQ